MKTQVIAASLALIVVSFVSSGVSAGAKDQTAKDWQIKSLKGVTSIKYGVAWDPQGTLVNTLTSALAGLNVPTNSVNLKDDKQNDLSTSEGRLKVYTDNRENNKTWVGLSLEQRSKLDRDSSITFDTETYSIGKLVDNSKVDDAIKELCAQFMSDFGAKEKKAADKKSPSEN